MPGRIAADRDRRVALVLDEFQEVVEIDPGLIKLMRSVFQEQPEVAHVYLGSKRHMMRRIFNDENEPFWRSAKQTELGVIPPEMITAGFDIQRPAGRLAGQIRLWDNMWNDAYVEGFRKMDRWGAETLPLAGEYYRQIVKELMWKNSLNEGTLSLGGREVRIEDIRVPLLHMVAEHDSLVPPACAAPLVARASSTDKEEIILKGGHVSVMAGPHAIKRLWPALDQWLGKRST